MLVRIENAKQGDSTKEMSGEDLLKRFKSAQHVHTGQIVAADRLLGDDMLLQTTTVEAREALGTDTTLAWIVRRSFPVMAHGASPLQGNPLLTKASEAYP